MHTSVRTVLGFVLCLLIGASALLAPPAFATGTDRVIYNDPTGRTASPQAISYAIARDVARLKRRDKVFIGAYSFQEKTLARALVRAHKRGVSVRMIVNGHLMSGTQKWLIRVLGTNRHKRSWVMTDHLIGVFHMKFAAFKRGDRSWVYLGSANPTVNGEDNQYNEMTRFVTDPKIYGFMARLFNQLKQGRPLPSKLFQTDSTTIITYPRSNTGWSDPAAYTLGKVGCKVNPKSGYGYKGRTLITIDMHAWLDQRGIKLARMVRHLWKQGCRVQIRTGEALGGRVAQYLKGMTLFKWDRTSPYTHKKMLLVNGMFNGKPGVQSQTGSDNWGDLSRNNRELVIKSTSRSLYNQQRTIFVRTVRRG